MEEKPQYRSEEERRAAEKFEKQHQSDHENNEQQRLTVPEGKLASPERDSRPRTVLGHIDIPVAGSYEFYRPSDIMEPDSLDLFVEDSDGDRFTVAKTLINFNDTTNRYEVDFYDYLYSKPTLKMFNQHGDMSSIIQAYDSELESHKIDYIQKRAELSNSHHIHASHFDDTAEGLDYEHIHQQQEGDCILATTLNTLSFNGDGHLPMTVLEARAQAVILRQDRNADASDIVHNDDRLNTHDFAYLLSNLSGRPLQTEDLNIDGINNSEREIKLEILERLDRLADSDYKTMAIGTGNHARAIKDLGDSRYALIDPLRQEGAITISVEQVVDYFARQCVGRGRADNFFYII